MARRGLNCTLSYANGKSALKYSVRCSAFSYGFDMIATESQARRQRAYYPHMTAPTQFAVTVDLIGQAERKSLNAYLMKYANYILDPGLKGSQTPQMTVTVPSRNWTRIGVPIGGMEFGTNLGAMVFSPTLVFETSGEPIDWDEKFRISSVYANRAYLNSPSSEFFYPTGTQLKGGDSPAVPGVDSIQAAINGSGGPDLMSGTGTTTSSIAALSGLGENDGGD